MNSKFRSGLIFLVFGFLYLVVVINLFVIQIWQRDFFANLGRKQYSVELVNYPPRGLILDRHGHPVALNKEAISAFILPRQIQDRPALIKFLSKHAPQALERLGRYSKKHFMYVLRHCSPEFYQAAQEAGVVDLKFMKEPSRFYPNSSLGQLVGMTDIDNVGLFGFEQQYNSFLAGQPSQMLLEKEARSAQFFFKRELQKSGAPGQNLRLTIDSVLQDLVTEALCDSVTKLEAELGAVVVMDPKNGDILALAGCPGFDPNGGGEIDLNRTKPIALVDTYELGSVMKIFVAIAALSEGVVTADEIIDCENREETAIDGMRFTTVHANGKIPFSEVMVHSNNIGMVKVAMRMREKLYDHYRKLGFGTKTGLNFAGEQSGYVSHPKNWSKRSIVSLSFGYELTANLVQLARAFSVIANDGYLVEPRLILDQPTCPGQQIYPAETIKIAQEMLRDTVQHGTGVRAKIKGYDVIGKTGTARLVVNGEYSHTNQIYTFAGIVQKGSWRRVIVTFIKNTKNYRTLYGANTAAPLFEKVAELAIIRDKIT